MARQEHGGAWPTRLFKPRPNFLTRTATDEAAQLNRRFSILPIDEEVTTRIPDVLNVVIEPRTTDSAPTTRRQSTTRMTFSRNESTRSLIRKQKSTITSFRDSSAIPTIYKGSTPDNKEINIPGSRPGAMPRPVSGQAKLGTFAGVFVPTSLNVLSILMFLRFGFILGQGGFLGMMGMLVISYIIDLVTTLSISAIATNGTVRGGGSYYLISRSLGPEFGGSIGVVFYLGSVFNTGMNAVGLVDCFKQNFGALSGNWAGWMPEGFWWEYLWATIILVICTVICLAGSGVFARCSNTLLAILLVATFSIPLSALLVHPFKDEELGIEYTGLRAETFKGNLLPQFKHHAAGSKLPGKESYQDLFGVLFPACAGIFAGTSMSGDLKHPNKAIPKGTLSGLALTFFSYSLVIICMAGTITRVSFYNDLNIIQDTSLSGVLILLGEFATTFFSSLMGLLGAAKLLQALARDNLLPGFSIFGQGNKGSDEPTVAIFLTHVIAQVALLCNINQLASVVTMAYLMTFLITNLACFLLRVSSAPNFRPSFHYFNKWTAGFGTLISGASMFFVDGLYAAGCVGILVVIFLIIHLFSPPKSWGDVSQSLIYHQVRKYLLRLRQEHLKYWRPQVLLFIKDPRAQYQLIQFCNSLKKGGLLILGHIIINNNFNTTVPEARRQQAAWTKYIDFTRVKAFVNISISPAIEWGTRNLVLSAGLGGMRPNIVILGVYNLANFRQSQPLIDIPSLQSMSATSKEAFQPKVFKEVQSRRDSKTGKMRGILPTDACKSEGDIGPAQYVTILEDLLLGLQINVALAKGFKDLEFPHPHNVNSKKFIDLWPIQMSGEIASEGHHNVLTSNFDTYTLILQLGCILNTVPSWKKAYKLRVAVFVEYESDVAEEQARVKTLLDNLRINGEVLVFWLASGDVKTYQMIVNGETAGINGGNDLERKVDKVLEKEEWWQDLRTLRSGRREGSPQTSEELAPPNVHSSQEAAAGFASSSFRPRIKQSYSNQFAGVREILRNGSRRRSSKNLSGIGVHMGMKTHRLHDDLVERHASCASASEGSESSDEDQAIAFATDTEDESASQGNFSGDIDTSNEYFESSIPSTKDPANDDSEQIPLGLSRPQYISESSDAKFSSKPVKQTSFAKADGPGRTITFTAEPSSPQPHHSVYDRRHSAISGYPSQQSIPLTFNDLPCRAQHLILNELIRQHSEHTAVVFTTLPSPIEGTCRSEEDSVRYLSDLEVLCEGLSPVLLVHSNSMTVTTSL